MRLSEIDPEQLAETEHRRAVDRVHSLLLALAPLSNYTLALGDGGWRGSVYGHAVYCLARYAKHGAALDADVHEYCVSLIGPGDHALDDSGAPDPSTDLGMVVAGALAREKLADGGRRKVTVRELSILGGVDPNHVRLLGRKGEIEIDDGEIRASEARRWLSGRGVPGFGS